MTTIGADDQGASEWADVQCRGTAAYTDLATTLATAGRLMPPVPPPLVEQLVGVNWAWSTTTALEPWDTYLFGHQVIEYLLSPSTDDLWFLSHRGHGVNSYGLSLVARIGGLAVYQQLPYGGAYMHDDGEAVDSATQSWAHLSLELAPDSRPADTAVLFSSFRGVAAILSTDSRLQLEPTDEDLELPTGWFQVYQYVPGDTDALSRLRQGESRSSARRWRLQLAAEHLWRLLHPEDTHGPYPKRLRIR